MKVPFRIGIVLIEREIAFSYNLAALEIATNEILKCELYEIGEKDPYELNIAILYGAYIQACRERYKKPKYKDHHAIIWMAHMGKESRDEFFAKCTELMGKLKGKPEVGEKKK